MHVGRRSVMKGNCPEYSDRRGKREAAVAGLNCADYLSVGIAANDIFPELESIGYQESRADINCGIAS